MEIGWKWLGSVLTFIAVILFEAFTGVSLDEFYLLDLIFQNINNSFMPLLPTAGPFAQSTDNIKLIVSLVDVILFLMPPILLAGGVYRLIPDEY
ncbi:hypothetical protein [Methanosarcina sp.]|uniref:hypothetical protein n=1 Tax=Methanosarcina sp. TaxID=2213 RepID=UPI002B9EE1D7|nr:hypothetical protein [Methanosarcina sp.]HOW13492.1 hypothetical protein [Methanosarcina sp.]